MFSTKGLVVLAGLLAVSQAQQTCYPNPAQTFAGKYDTAIGIGGSWSGHGQLRIDHDGSITFQGTAVLNPEWSGCNKLDWSQAGGNAQRVSIGFYDEINLAPSFGYFFPTLPRPVGVPVATGYLQSGSGGAVDFRAAFVSSICPMPASEWLTTEFAPALNTVASGFTIPGVKDRFRIVFEEHRKYFDVVPSSSGLTEAAGDLTVAIAEETAVVNAANPLCWDTYTVDVDWSKLVTKCARSEEGTGLSGFVVFTCKIEVDGKETLSAIRSTTLTRTMHHEMPFIVKFPKQAAASVGGLSAFAPPNVLAAIIRQEVTLDVSAVTDVSAKIRLFTSAQWPFKLNTATPNLVSVPAGMNPQSFASFSDCADAEAGDAPNPTVDDANACSQTWEIDMDIDATVVCELDGDYQVTFEAQCQPSFAALTDCPLVQDDQGQIDNVFTIDFKIDSENFCAQVVDSVDIAAALAVYKDHSHVVPATNFIQAQTAYFVATASSSKVTVVKASVDDIKVEITGPPNAGLLNLWVDGAAGADLTAGLSLVIENSDANGTPDQAWFQFVVADSPFAAPLDGSADFDVTVTLNVEFKDAQGVLMLEKQTVQLLQASKSQSLAASAAFGVAATDDADTSSASAVGLGLAASAAAFAAFA